MAQVHVSDDYGNDVRLAAPAKRIVSLSPHLTELLYAAGAGS
ncbi:MAG TPA: cobalamin-binding protein, partial [Burkholderiales bacterium]|nr:cobalamin-binding protein [Burkholderiales bacterium]